MTLNTIYNENCLITLKKLADESIDLVLTSPPYDGLRTYNGYSFPFEDIAKELTRVLKKGGVIVWVVADATIDGDETGTSFRQALFFKQCGLKLFDTMIYKKTGTPFPSRVRYNGVFEYMFVFSKGKPKTFNPIMKKNKTAGDTRKTKHFRQKDGTKMLGMVGKPIKEYGIEENVWVFSNGMNRSSKDKIAFDHPAIFPEDLADRHIKSWTNKGDLVYDPFMGSGTTAKMAILNDRKYIGSEMSEKYVKIIKERIVIATKQYANEHAIDKFFQEETKV